MASLAYTERMAKRGRSLGSRITRLGILVFASMGALQFAALGLSAWIRFGEIESRASADHVERLRAAVATERESLSDLVRENAEWDDMRELAERREGGRLTSLLPSDWMDRAGLDFLCLWDLDGRILWLGARVDPAAPLARRPAEESSTLTFFGRLPAGEGATFLSSRLGPLIVATMQVRDTTGKSAAAGRLSFGRLLLRASLGRIESRVRLPVKLASLGSLSGFSEERSGDSAFFLHDEGAFRELVVPFSGEGADEPFALGMRYERSSGRAAARLLLETGLAFLATAALALAWFSSSLRRLALFPVLRIAAHIDRASEGSYDPPLALGSAAGRRDEVGILADRVDQLIESERRRTEELAAANQELELRAATDALTGLPNRRSFGERLERERRRLVRERRGATGDAIAFVICDIDCFKRYNDRYGHSAGDACLRAVADAIAGALRRPTDLACRQGGEEFLVMLPGTDAEGGACVAENIRKAVEELGLPHEDSMAAPFVTLSLGVASMTCDEGFDSQALFARADAALYEAKSGGRNRVVVAR